MHNPITTIAIASDGSGTGVGGGGDEGVIVKLVSDVAAEGVGDDCSK